GFSQLQRMKRKRVVRLLLFRIESRVVSRPVGLFKRKPGSDVFQDAAIRRKAKGSLKFAVLPHCVGKPINGTVHRVQTDCATQRWFNKGRLQCGWIVESKLFCSDDRQARETTNNQFIVWWAREKQTSIFERLKPFRWEQLPREYSCSGTIQSGP